MSIYIPADCVTVQSTHELPVGSGMIEIPAADVLALMAALGTPVTESEIIVQILVQFSMLKLKTQCACIAYTGQYTSDRQRRHNA